jgi:DEAD/DEAH box helicase domain-containing protein
MANLSFFEENQWRVVDVLHTPEQRAVTEGVDDLDLLPVTKEYLARGYPQGIYRHQKEALRAYLSGQPVCMATGTASGKSLVFQTAAVDLLARDPQARIMAIYPMKALSNEQKERWEAALQLAGYESTVGRIDGNVAPGLRLSVLERSRVVVFTPDIIHAWLFSNLNQAVVLNFLEKVSLIVVDEVHAYTGVFGSNAAFLFRRIRHLLALLRARPRLICASATIAQPERHLDSLFGMQFRIIGPELDTSPHFPLEVVLVEPPPGDRALEPVIHLLDHLANVEHARFITFVDSRKQVELISSILARTQREKDNEKAGEKKGDKTWEKANPEEPETGPDVLMGGVLVGLNVLPYRAGYEERDRSSIQERLTTGGLNGVVSTSALELGIDIPDLDTCVLIGVPSSATSLQQRIGRIGRHAPGTVFVINGGDVHDRTVFANPGSFFDRPLAESALYLENHYIQYIHVLCLARSGGEHSQVLQARKLPDGEFVSPVKWPTHFLELCREERSGSTPRELMGMKAEGRERPNYSFPLREVESQFKVERIQGPTPTALGSLSFGQLMREAYPGAIYYYATTPYRVTRVNLKGRQVQVRREKRYTTRPSRLPDRVFPRMNASGIFSVSQQEGLLSSECQLLVRESINGVVENRGGNEAIYTYPLPRELGFFQDQPFFNRNYFTTGVMISDPALCEPGVHTAALAELLYEVFLMLLPFDRQDIGWSADVFREAHPPFIGQEQPFLAIYDQVYGSLRLSARILGPGLLGCVLLDACLLAGRQAQGTVNAAGKDALVKMCKRAFKAKTQRLDFRLVEQPLPQDAERVILPESKGLLLRSSEEFHVVRIIQLPGAVCYEGIPASLTGSAATIMPQLLDVAEIPGESLMGLYYPDSGKIEEIPLNGNELVGEEITEPALDTVRIGAILAEQLNETQIAALAQQFGVRLPAGSAKLKQASALVDGCFEKNLICALIDQVLAEV